MATAISRANQNKETLRRIRLCSRNPHHVDTKLRREGVPTGHMLPPVSVDVTRPETLETAFQGSDFVVSLVGILQGTPEQFEKLQWKGAKNIAQASLTAGAKLIHISAIGANKNSHIAYERSKGLGEEAVLSICPDAVVIRPSLVFGPGDEFFGVRTLRHYLYPSG